MKIIHLFLSFVLLLIPINSYAEKDVYFLAGVGVVRAYGLDQFNISDRILNIEGVSGTHDEKYTSTDKIIAISYCFSKHLCADFGYIWGIEFQDSVTVNNYTYGPIDINIPQNLSDQLNIPATQTVSLSIDGPVKIVREAKMTTTQANLTFLFPVNEAVEIFTKLGWYDYTLTTTEKFFPISGNETFLGQEKIVRGTAPMGSLGVYVKVKKVRLGFEGQKTGKISIMSFTASYLLE